MMSGNRAKKNWWLGSICLLTGLMIGVAASSLVRRSPSGSPGGQNKNPVVASHAQKPSKPWGDMDVLKIPFADPTEIFPDRSIRLQKPKWFFENFSAEQLAQFFISCGLNDEEQKELADKLHIELAANGCIVSPSENLVCHLGSAARQKIYAILETNPLNYSQQYPFRFATNEFDARFDGSGLPPEKLRLIQSLTYSNRGDLCLADLQALPGMLSADEFERAMDFLYRFPVYRLRVRMFSDSDVESVVKYWGRGGREQKIRPLLSSLGKVLKPDGASINISYLLPPFARLHLYTFPNAWDEPNRDRQDCFWSSMNFFNDEPDPRFLEGSYVKEVLGTKYHLIHGEPMYGDLITLLDRNGNGLHMCVYLADNFVFTKNGVNTLSPWVIMKTSDMLLLFFPSKEDRRFVIYRRNDLT